MTFTSVGLLILFAAKKDLDPTPPHVARLKLLHQSAILVYPVFPEAQGPEASTDINDLLDQNMRCDTHPLF